MSNLKPRIKHISLAFMGAGWEECYLNFRAFRWADIKDTDTENKASHVVIEETLAVLKRSFLDGKGIGTDGQVLDITADDLDDLDLEALTTIGQQLGGQPDPNA